MINTLKRLLKFLFKRCIVCNKKVPFRKIVYCSFECACYDKAFNVNGK